MARTKGFVADAAHELKTPVSIIRDRVGARALRRRGARSEYREALHAIGLESTRLSDLVSDLTLLAEGELLDQPARAAAAGPRRDRPGGRPLARRRGRGRAASGSRSRPRRGSSCAATSACCGGWPSTCSRTPSSSRRRAAASTSVLSREAGRVVLRVLDEAHTLSGEERGRVFERFYRSQRARSEGDSRAAASGLAIVQWAVALHGGAARVEPRAPRGNAFVIELPAA